MGRFGYFVIFAEMRTGSNLLEASLETIDGISCFGELFNQHFIGGPKRDRVFDITLEQREKDPLELVKAMRAKTDGIGGFRLFHDHDARVVDHVINDPECAKIILTRNPVDAFISRKIAGETGQWKLGDAKDRKEARIHFDMPEFEEYLSVRQAFQREIRQKLQSAGQTAFWVTYSDIQSVDTIKGLARYLGVDAEYDRPVSSIKKQNPEPISEKVLNFDEMETALRGFDWVDLDAAPNFEPERGPAVPKYMTAAKSPILFQPIEGGPVASVVDWLTQLDGQGPVNGHTQKMLRQWFWSNPNRTVFTVLRHPVERAYHAFAEKIVLEGDQHRAGLRRILVNRYGVEMPKSAHDVATTRAAFIGFLGFLAGNLAGQTSVGVDPSWASQKSILDGMSKVVFPDVIIRENELAEKLGNLAADAPKYGPDDPLPMAQLKDVYCAEIETAARKTYRRDYQTFGFGDWA